MDKGAPTADDGGGGGGSNGIASSATGAAAGTEELRAAASTAFRPVPGAAPFGGAPATRAIPTTSKVIVIGAGPAGIGTAALLEKCGINTVVLERGDVGQSFLTW
jgi:NADPH-dependent 2,4-dienoyl-CoA reductase/sulfur reductase-like enzyme